MKRGLIATIALLASPVLGDGDGSTRYFSFANDVEGSFVRTIVGLKESGLKQAKRPWWRVW